MTKPYQNFLERLDNKEPETKEKYINDFKYYLLFLRTRDPNSLITKKFYSPQEIQKIEDKIISYITFQKKQGLKHTTITTRKSAIQFFYRANRITLDWHHISGYIPRLDKAREDEAYTTEDIQKMLDVVTGERDRFLIYLLASTGMRIGALTDLKYGDIEPIKPDGYQGKHLYKIIVYRGHRAQYYTFTTFECAEALDSYIEYRKRMGEAITDNSPLLRNAISSNLPWVKKLKEVKPVKSFIDPIYRITNKAGIRTRTHNRQTQHKHMLDHAFRKFCNTKMIEARLEHNTKEFLLGHKVSRGLDNEYDRTPVHNRLSEYLKAIELLTISPENILRKKLAESEMTINTKLAQKDKQISALERQMRQYRKEVQMLMSNPKQVQKMLAEISNKMNG
jgi:integrase